MSTTAQKPLPIIHLNGFPGTGKLTVAKCLQKMLGPHGRLVHNHLLINPADAVLHRTEPGYQDLRRAIRSAVFSSLAQSAATHAFAYLFTDFQSSDPVGSATCAEYLDAARARGCSLVSVVMSCDEAANVERLVTSERRAHGKIVDRELLGKFRSGVDIHRFDGPDHASLELDVTQLSAEEAAHRILQHVFRTCPEVERAVAGGKAS
ncbi:hypothetical protein E5D57_009626 [Metarhizium anisopliae]|nr:hypothetical protein E5D57_009626 [Metarhizium anisopliae]